MNKFLAGASIFCVIVIISGLNRGFDFTDEGLYALLTEPNQENKAGIFNYDLFFKLYFRLTGYTFSLIELRLLRLLSYLLAAFALVGFWKHLTGDAKIKAEIFWISSLGLFAGYAFLPPTLSYNSLTVVLTCFWLNLITKEQKSILIALLLGVIVSAMVYVKISLVLIFLPATFLILIFWQKVKPIHSLVLMMPLLLSELIFLFLLGENAWMRLQEGIPLNVQRNGYQFAMMVKSIAVGGFWLCVTGAIFFGIAYFRNSKSPLYTAMKIIAIYSLLVICYLTHITDEWNPLVLLAAGAFFGYQIGLGSLQIGKTNLWIIFLILLPFILHFGSNVYWLRSGIQYLVFWLLGFRWLFGKLKSELSLGIGFLSIFLVFNGIWWHPFGHEKPLWTHKLEWKMDDGNRLLLDPELVRLATEIKEFQSHYSQSEIVTAYRIPGMAYLTGSTIPLSPGIWEKSQLEGLFGKKPKMMIYNNLQDLPESWTFNYQKELGVFRSDSLQLLWD